MLCKSFKSSSSFWNKQTKNRILWRHCAPSQYIITPTINLLKCSLQDHPAAAGENATTLTFSLRWAEARRWLSSGLFSWTGRRRCQWPKCTFGRSSPESLPLGENCQPRRPCLYPPGGARQLMPCWRWCSGQFRDGGTLRSCFSSWWKRTGLVCSGEWRTGLRWLVEIDDRLWNIWVAVAFY